MECPTEIRMAPSSRLVLRALSGMKVATLRKITEETGLPLRTTQSALKKLIEMHLITVKICLSDSRRRFFCYSISKDD